MHLLDALLGTFQNLRHPVELHFKALQYTDLVIL